MSSGRRRSLRLGDVTAGRCLQRAEVARERALRVVGQALVVEHQHGVAIHARLDRRHVFARQGLRDVDPGHFAGECRRDLSYGDGHGCYPPGCHSAARASCSAVISVPPTVVRRMSRTLVSSNRRTRCMT